MGTAQGHYYTATFRPRISDAAWGATPASVKQSTLGTAIGQIGAQVTAAARGGGFDAADSRLIRSPLTVDDQGWHELAQLLETLNRRVQEIEAGSRARLSDGANGQHAANVVLMLFKSPDGDGTGSPGGSSGAS
jgi:hypothetical protein